MSEFAGLWRPDDGPIDANVVNDLALALHGRGCGKAEIWHRGSVAFVARPWLTPAGKAVEAPLFGSGDGSVLVASAHLTERSDLARRLERRPDTGDGELVRDALARWGAEESVSKLRGDFA